MPLDHLEPCHTCDATGRDCKKESEGGPGVSGVDFVLYVSSVVTDQCLEAVGEHKYIYYDIAITSYSKFS